MKALFFLIIPFLSFAQLKYPKLTPEQDHAIDFYSRAGLTWGVSEVSYRYTHKKFLSAMIGLGTGVLSSLAERQLYGKLVGVGGSITGDFAFAVRWDIKERRRKEFLEKRKSFQT